MNNMNDFDKLLDNPQNRRILALGLIGVGALFFFGQFFSFNFSEILWPFFVIVPGLFLLYQAYNGDDSLTGLMFPGVIVTGTGVILFYQSLTGHWESWAYVWAVYPGLVGLATRWRGERLGQEKDIRTGTEMMRWSFTAFIGFFLFFELLIFNGFGGWLPLVLIGAGVLLLMSMSRKARSSDDGGALKAKRKHDEDLVI